MHHFLCASCFLLLGRFVRFFFFFAAFLSKIFKNEHVCFFKMVSFFIRNRPENLFLREGVPHISRHFSRIFLGCIGGPNILQEVFLLRVNNSQYLQENIDH